MLKELKCTAAKINGYHMCEIKVVDDKTNEIFYVCAIPSQYLYITYKTSYIEYLSGNGQPVPEIVENDFEVVEYGVGAVLPRFYDFYHKALAQASRLKYKEENRLKYAHLKKPIGNIKYKVLNKRHEPDSPFSDEYEIEFLLLDDNSHLFVNFNGTFTIYLITRESLFGVNADTDEIPEAIESINDFRKAKKSKYYDLYLEMEKYLDDYDQ